MFFVFERGDEWALGPIDSHDSKVDECPFSKDHWNGRRASPQDEPTFSIQRWRFSFDPSLCKKMILATGANCKDSPETGWDLQFLWVSCLDFAYYYRYDPSKQQTLPFSESNIGQVIIKSKLDAFVANKKYSASAERSRQKFGLVTSMP